MATTASTYVRASIPGDAPAVRALFRNSRQVYQTLAEEDLVTAVNKGQALLHLQRTEGPPTMLAAMIMLHEERPETLQELSPNRVFLRGLAIRRNQSPTTSVRQMLGTLVCMPRRNVEMLIAYSTDAWSTRAYNAVGMILAEKVRYYKLENLPRLRWADPPPGSECIVVEKATPADLRTIAMLDAVTFEPLWHISSRDLNDLMVRGPMLVAATGPFIVGYVSVLLEQDIATIARLAVHPQWQGRGIGRQLLVAGLRAAQSFRCTVAMLNTQATNVRSQQLYRSMNFRLTGRHFSVFTQELPVTGVGVVR